MTVNPSGESCPECGTELQVIYATELEQVISGWACGNCGYISSEREQFEDSVELSGTEQYILRIEKPLTDEDVRDPRTSVRSEFRARAKKHATGEEVWLLIDPEDESIVDLYAPDQNTDETSEK